MSYDEGGRLRCRLQWRRWCHLMRWHFRAYRSWLLPRYYDSHVLWTNACCSESYQQLATVALNRQHLWWKVDNAEKSSCWWVASEKLFWKSKCLTTQWSRVAVISAKAVRPFRHSLQVVQACTDTLCGIDIWGWIFGWPARDLSLASCKWH